MTAGLAHIAAEALEALRPKSAQEGLLGRYVKHYLDRPVPGLRAGS